MSGSMFVGLDVHALRTVAATLDPGTGELSVAKLDTTSDAIVDFLADVGPGCRAVYEAGPTGFVLARAAAERGIDLRVVAPGLIPRKPSDRVKTDRKDAIRLARLLAAGELSFARTPTLEEEAFRDLVRAREDVRRDLTAARHRLSKFLLRRELRWTGRCGRWTGPYVQWLRGLSFPDPASHTTLVEYVAAHDSLLQRRSALEQAIKLAVPASPYAQTIARLRCFRGIDTLTAAGLAAEIGDFGRFAHPKLVASFVGLVPSEHTSDTRRRLGSITKAGSQHARWLLVESAHHYRRKPLVGRELTRRQHGQDPRACQVAWRAQQRLYKQYRKLRLERHKPAGVVTIAQARELSTFLWEAATLH
ncbi:MAG: IS110 family transposase [Thermoleophilaceae bacterium]|nr:IS110 family transposase [Thermoleophilaceae bacterium]